MLTPPPPAHASPCWRSPGALGNQPGARGDTLCARLCHCPGSFPSHGRAARSQGGNLSVMGRRRHRDRRPAVANFDGFRRNDICAPRFKPQDCDAVLRRGGCVLHLLCRAAATLGTHCAPDQHARRVGSMVCLAFLVSGRRRVCMVAMAGIREPCGGGACCPGAIVLRQGWRVVSVSEAQVTVRPYISFDRTRRHGLVAGQAPARCASRSRTSGIGP